MLKTPLITVFLGHPVGLCTLQILQAYYENNKSPLQRWNNFKTDGSFTTFAKLVFTCKKLYFVNDEVRAWCPKLGQTTLFKTLLKMKSRDVIKKNILGIIHIYFFFHRLSHIFKCEIIFYEHLQSGKRHVLLYNPAKTHVCRLIQRI